MPPRRNTQASSVAPALAGMVIAISGSIPRHTQAGIESRLIIPLGATLAKSVDSSTTHLVTTETDYRKPSVKVKAAQASGIPIVTFEWLQDCLDREKHMNEQAYSLALQPSPTSGLRKRQASQNGHDLAQPPQSKKGKASDENPTEETKEREPKVAEGQVAKSSDVKIALDEPAAIVFPRYHVYIDDDNIIYDASLNQSSASNNANKFYRIQLLRSSSGNHKTWTRWGRVGEQGQHSALGNGSLDDALKIFRDKFRSKAGLTWENRGDQPKPGKYAFIEKSYEPDSEGDDDNEAQSGARKEGEPESKLSKPVQDLMKLIFNSEYFTNSLSDLKYDSKKMPLGRLSKAMITRGFEALKELSELLDDPSLAASRHGTGINRAHENLSNLYFTIIPHAFGRDRPPIIQTQSMLKQEIELLESLADMKDADLLMKAGKKEDLNKLDSQFRGLGLKEMTPLSEDSGEFCSLKKYLIETRGETHNLAYEVQEIFRIERDGEFGRFDASHKNPRDRRLLWHGSRCTNYGGILSQGLRIAPPEAPVSGYMFGKGIYLADMSSKSANYCCPYISNRQALLLLCEAELGDPLQTLTNARSNAAETAKADNMLSTWGQGMTGPTVWKDAECVHPSLKGVKMPDTTVKPGRTNVPNAYLQYNEYICYDVSQVRLRYLLRVTI
ncbi:poly polymerase catalytic domain-containing protein [Xylaria arbuscula]|nr:poly polymerase catalytic domain-containing protein [Xylaria arbuscula]